MTAVVRVNMLEKKKIKKRGKLVCEANLKPCFHQEILSGNNLFRSLKNFHTKRFNYRRKDKQSTQRFGWKKNG